ncbi:MAG: Ltp family lipoprotein [Lachnospiraceae bacterium]|jgi:hypothetical protein
MKCPNCGADTEGGKFCEFCGSQIPYDMLREQEQLKKSGCPKCGSTNINFTRENQGEVRGKNSKRIIHQTVGFCKDCGATWYPSDQTEPVKKRRTWLWVLGWIFIFPVPLTVLMLRKKEMKPVIRYGIIAAAWIVYLIIGFSGKSSDNKKAVSESKTEEAILETKTETEESDGIEDLLEVEIIVEAKTNEDDGSVLFGVTTNLPEDTLLSVTVSNGSFEAEDEVVILKDGTGYTSEFSDNGAALQGEYKVSVELSDPSAQKESVQKVIGKDGEFIAGSFVKKSSDGASNVVAAEFEFYFDGISGDTGESDETELASLETLSTEQRNAIRSAESYLEFTGFSKIGLVSQLSSEYGDQYPEEVAEFAVQYLEDNNMVDWTEEAIESAQSYLSFSGFSKLGLIDQLTSEYGEQFTREEADSAVQYLEENSLVNWNDEAVESAQSYLDFSAFSRNELYDQLTGEYGDQYTPEQAEYALTQVYDK